MSEFSLILVLQTKENPTIDMAKIQIKSERLTPFGGLFSIMEQFDSTLSSVIDSSLGLRCGSFGCQYSEIIRSFMSITVEGYHRQVRKVTKNKGVFPSDTALEELVYLAYRDISEKWTMPLSNWALISQQLAIKFGDRFKIM